MDSIYVYAVGLSHLKPCPTLEKVSYEEQEKH